MLLPRPYTPLTRLLRSRVAVRATVPRAHRFLHLTRLLLSFSVCRYAISPHLAHTTALRGSLHTLAFVIPHYYPPHLTSSSHGLATVTAIPCRRALFTFRGSSLLSWFTLRVLVCLDAGCTQLPLPHEITIPTHALLPFCCAAALLLRGYSRRFLHIALTAAAARYFTACYWHTGSATLCLELLPVLALPPYATTAYGTCHAYRIRTACTARFFPPPFTQIRLHLPPHLRLSTPSCARHAPRAATACLSVTFMDHLRYACRAFSACL